MVLSASYSIAHTFISLLPLEESSDLNQQLSITLCLLACIVNLNNKMYY